MKTVLRFFLIILLLAITLALNIGSIDIRMREMNYLLGKAADDKGTSRSLGIVTKYELIKRRIEQGEADFEDYELEAKIQTLMSGEQLKEDDGKDKTYLVPVRHILNGIRVVLGKPVINPREENKIFEVLEIGYFWERTRRYSEAIKTYEDVLGMNDIDNDIRASVLIHKAFCHSMMSEYESAKGIYERVINQYPHTDAGILSWKLLDFIQSIEKQREQLSKRNLTQLDKAKQYYLLMDYRGAIKNYSGFLRSDNNDKATIEARFFKGRSHEELGEVEEALIEYRAVIRNKGKWVRQANRRMLMLGEFYEQKKQMAQEAREQLEAYKDQKFMAKVEQFSKMMSTSSIRNELEKELQKSSAGGNPSDQELMSLINNIGDLDLTGKKERRKQMEELTRKMIEEQGLSKSQAIELQRKQLLAGNPFRRPSVLKNTIDENASQLRYLYNKRLRSGDNLSGKMLVEMEIKADGAVANLRIVQSNLGDQKFERLVSDKINSWRFRPVPDSLGAMKIRYPFEFYKEM